MIEPIKIARLEEQRQAIGTAEVATDSEPVGGGIMSYAGPGQWCNQACGMGLHGPVADADLDRLVEFYASRGVEPKVELAPFVDDSLIRGLAERGFTLREFENVLVRETTPGEDISSMLPFGWASGLEIHRVDPEDDQHVRAFIEASSGPFRPEDESQADGFDAVMRRVVHHPRSDSYLATIDGRAVGGGAMETAGEVACLFGASVRDGFRRRGVQQALIATRVLRAAERGAQYVCIHSRPGIATERNAARLGFQVAYTKVVMAKPGDGLVPSP